MSSLFPLPSPTLPECKSLLLKGTYHPSAPIHLCLTHVANRPDTTALFFTPSRHTFLSALRDYQDDWLEECGGYGAVFSVLSKVNIYYPPTPLHLSLALSMLKVSDAVGDDLSLPHQAILGSPPSLLVLHELSSYFLDNPALAPTLASYLSLVALALASVTALSTQHPQCPTTLVLIDSRIDSLKLPVLKHPFPIVDEPESDSSDASYKVGFLAQSYFEWVGTFESQAPRTDLSASKVTGSSHELRLHQVRMREDSSEDVIFRWRVRKELPRKTPGRQRSVFIWN
ncbi:hypothetical protein FA95DRAFT_1552973 [Auriscalpium vulgare]|uniref:Uncharacterized protein n=1 Tax=Auriscalpium vulgare TaxID=40419 RepID=A0ACB8S9B6_9AGAM|nr:hypothetical protein FA95DRAFT_1552973 [Auriscalpium vulgare]